MRNLKQFTGYLLAAGLIVGAPACAATFGEGAYGGYHNPYPDYRGEIARRAYGKGYEEGREHGRSDARKGRQFDYRRHDEFRDADAGYHRGDGDREYYREAFRRGFMAGYGEAYRVSVRDRDEDGYRGGGWRR
jgi:hypothetical protein